MRKRDPAKVEEQRERILKAAMTCFVRKGLHATSTDDICRAADISSGSLYYYFKSRDALIRDLIIHVHAIRDDVLTDLDEVPNLLEAVIEAQYASIAAFESHGFTTQLYLELLAYSARNDAARQAFHAAADHVIEVIGQAVRAHQRAGKLPTDISADALALFLPVAASGMTIAQFVHGGFDRTRYEEAFSTLLFRDLPKVERAAPAKRAARARG